MARSLTVLIPTLNEEHGIGPVLDEIPRARLEGAGWDVEVLIIDGDSKDRTREIAQAKGARVVVESRRGYGRAYKTGFQLARGDWIVTADADGTYPLEDVPVLLERAEREGFDFVTTNRFHRLEPGAMSGKHKLGNWLLSTATRVLFPRSRFNDSQSGMWVFRREILQSLDVRSDGMPLSEEFKIEAFRRLGVRAAEWGIRYRPRLGEAKIESWADGWRNLSYLFRMRMRSSTPGAFLDEPVEEGDASLG
jgi:glycosyltransferase involved in cell wall biosynthesis